MYLSKTDSVSVDLTCTPKKKSTKSTQQLQCNKQNKISLSTKIKLALSNNKSTSPAKSTNISNKKKKTMNTVLISLITIWFGLCTTLVIRQTQLNLVFYSFISFFGVSSILERFFLTELRRNDAVAMVQRTSRAHNLTKYFVGIVAGTFSFSQLVCKSSLKFGDDGGENVTTSSSSFTFVGYGDGRSSGVVVGDGEYEFRSMAILAGYLAFDLWYTHINNCRPIKLYLVVENSIMLTILLIVLTKIDPSHFPYYRPRIVALLTYKLARIVLGLLLLHASFVNEDESGTSNSGMIKCESRDDLTGHDDSPNGDGSSFNDGNADDRGCDTVSKKAPSLTQTRILLSDRASRIAEERLLPNKTSLSSQDLGPKKAQMPQKLSPSISPGDNSSKQLWTIHGNSYDLSDFVTVHPGGVESILLGKGRDCTALFESYHPFTENHRHVLSRYKPIIPPHILKAMSIEGSNSKLKREKKTFAPLLDPFYETLKERVYNVLKQEHHIDPIKDRCATIPRAIYYFIIFVGLICSGYMHVKRSLLGSFLFALFGWLLGALGHDGGHYTVSRNPRINDLAVWGMSFLCNPIMWQVQHTYAHHTHTNDFDHDPDLHHFQMLLRVHRRFKADGDFFDKQRKISYVLFAYLFVVFGECLKIPIGFIMDGTIYGVVEWIDCHRIGRYVASVAHLVFYIGIIMLGPFMFSDTSAAIATGGGGLLWTLKGFAGIFIHIGSAGLMFALFSQINHLNEGSMMSGKNSSTPSTNENDESSSVISSSSKREQHDNRSIIKTNIGHTNNDGSKEKLSTPLAPAKDSWAAEQVETSNNFASGSIFWHFLSNGLNHQIEHHLFPGLNHCHLSLIAPIVQKTCEEFGVQYECYNTWGEIMNATLLWLDTLSGDV